MRRTVLGVLKTSRLLIVGLVLLLGTATSGIVMFSQPQMASAACTQDGAPETNILYCGVDSSSVSSAVSGLQTAYNNNSDGHGNTDIKAVYQAAGLQSSMFTSGTWALGTANDKTAGNGSANIVVNGNVVGTNVRIGSRCPNISVNCSPASQYQQFSAGSNVYTRDANWFFDKDSNGNLIHSVTTLVHLDDKGRADFAMWTPCGNFLLFTPTTPPPAQSVSCVSLTAQQVDNNQLQYNFTATAQQQNSSITSYSFDFGDNSTPQVVNVSNNATTAQTQHTYTQTSSQQQFTAQVTVNGNVTSNNCQTQVTIPPTVTPPQQQSLACVSLTASAVDNAQTQYTFTATAQQENTTIDHFSFQFGDSSPSQTVSTSSTTAQVSHTFSAPGTYNVQASVTGPLGTFNGSNCMTSVTVPTPPTTPPTLPNTGAGDVLGFFGITTALGGLFHQIVIRRRLLSK